MKRLLLILSRIGTVLIAVGLALVLVSLIPPTQLSSFGGSETVAPETFQPLGRTPPPFVDINFTFYSHFFSTITPQQELSVELECNGTIEVYLIKVGLYELMKNFDDLEPAVILLEDYLRDNPNLITWQGEILEGIIEYTPTEVINATLVLSNPSSNYVNIKYDGRIQSLLAPTEKVRNLAYWAIPIGFVLSISWFLDLWKNRKKTD